MELNDAEGRPLKQSILNYKGIYHMAEVTVAGTLVKDEGGNFSLRAEGIFVNEKTYLDVEETEMIKIGTDY